MGLAANIQSALNVLQETRKTVPDDFLKKWQESLLILPSVFPFLYCIYMYVCTFLCIYFPYPLVKYRDTSGGSSLLHISVASSQQGSTLQRSKQKILYQKKKISKKHSFHLPRQQSPNVFINGDSENTICLEEPKDPQAAFAILVVGMLFRAAAQTITNWSGHFQSCPTAAALRRLARG